MNAGTDTCREKVAQSLLTPLFDLVRKTDDVSSMETEPA
jgi:hypothetical protein